MAEPVIMLVDNGSKRAAATLSLRAIAADLSAASGLEVHPVSLQHSGGIDPEELGGVPALVLADFLRSQLAEGRREFVAVPLFFGMSRALTSFIPEQVASLTREFGEFTFRLADVLSPMPQGEPLLADILADNVTRGCAQLGAEANCVIVVDHGSPLPEVTAVRAKVTMTLRDRLPDDVWLSQAVMERRQGADYDFNGQLLGDLLDTCVTPGGSAVVVLAMMFISPGRHAGPGGDVEAICAEATARNPDLQLKISPLISEHPMLIDILQARLEAAIQSLD